LKYFLFFFLIFYISSSYSKDTSCRFEEVYIDGQTQQGYLLLTKNKSRYQYLDENLFTIFYENKDWNVIQNNSLKLIPKDQLNLELIKKVRNLIVEFPELKSPYFIDEYEINFEFRDDKKFLSNVVIKSQNLNLRIYFYDCDFGPINDIYFSSQPYFSFQKK